MVPSVAEQYAEYALLEAQRSFAAASFHDQLIRLADASESALVRLWGSSDDYTPAGSLVWHSDAKLILEASAQASVDATVGYLEYAVDLETRPVELVVREAGAHAFDPYDAMAAELKQQRGFVAALKTARTTVAAIANNAVFGAARTQMSAAYFADGRYRLGTFPGFMRRLNAGACKWCMNLADVVFDSAEQANFGHDNCRCFPFPADIVGDWNNRQREIGGWDEGAQRQFHNRNQIKKLEAQQRKALENSRNAAADYVTETDPARRERLSIREQEWETRGELIAERLRILRTGSHQIR